MLLAGSSVTAALDLSSLAVNSQSYDPSRILVRFSKEAGSLNGAEILSGTEIGPAYSRVPGLHEVWLDPGVSVEAALAAYQAHAAVLYAEPDYRVQLTVIPNDTQFASLWGLYNTGQTGGTADADIDAPEAWNLATGSSSIVVGVIDTGVDYTHPDLAANMWTNPGEVAADGIDNDANGYVDDVHGYDFFNNDGDPFDDHGHGTHVSGTIGAAGNNASGVAGVNWNVQIMGLKFLSGGGWGSTSGAIAAVNYATLMHQRGVNIKLTSNSWGGGGYSQALYDAIQASGTEGMLFVAAAGNSSSNNDLYANYPSNYDLDNVIAVAATDHNDALASFSSYGATTVDLGAPGVSTLSTTPGNTYSSFSGTSMATPHVAGVAALAWSVAPTASYQQIRNALFAGVDPIAALAGITVTGGRLNALGTLQQLGMLVAGSNPANGSVVAAPPTDFAIDFSNPYDPATIDASDLTVNALAADSFTLTDADTVTFHYAVSPVTAQGVQNMAMAAGAVTRLSDGDLLRAFAASFRYDVATIQVTATVPADGAVVTLPLTTLEVHFSEAYDPSSIGTGDLTVSQGSITAFALVDADTVQYTFSGITTEGTLTISMTSGAVTDLFGNAGAAYSGSLVLDFGTMAYPTPLESIAPLGSLIYDPSVAGSIGFVGDTDQFTIGVDAGQTMTIVVTPAAGLQPNIDLTGPGTSVSSGAATAGADAVLQTVTLTSPGTYTVTVSGLSATTGAYVVQVFLNAAVENEEHDGAANDNLASAQNIDGSFLALAGTAQRGAVLGTVGVVSLQYASTVIDFSSEWDPIYWGAIQALGPPDTFWYGDWETAWSPLPMNGTTEYLTLGFATPVYAEGVTIRETYGNGYVTQVDVLDTSDVLHTVWTGVDPSLPGSPADFLVSFPATAFLVKGVKIYVDTDHDLDAWEEIDAVQLHTAASAPLDTADFYAFTLGAGESVTLALTALQSGTVTLELQDSAGTTLATGVPASNLDAVINNFTAAGGTYYVRITGDSRLEYSLVITTNADFDTEGNDTLATAQPLAGLALGAVNSGAAAITTETEPNDDGVADVSLADLALANDWSGSFLPVGGNDFQATLTGQISAGSDVDWDFLKIQAAPGDALVVAMSGITLGDSYLHLFDNTGTEIAFDDDGGPWLDSLLTYSTFAYAGDYYIVADSYGSNTGTYTLTAMLTTANLLPTQDDDFYRITVAMGDRLTFSTTTPGDGPLELVNLLDPALDLYDPNGALVVSDDNGAGDGRNAELTYLALAAGTYTVRVRAAGGSRGEYTVRVQIDPNHAPIVENGDLILSAPSVSENGVVGLSGVFTDADATDTHTVTIDWGDGSAADTINLGAGVTSFGLISHTYQDDDPTNTSSDNKTITVTVADNRGGSDGATAAVLVTNVAPSAQAGLDQTVAEGTPVTLNGTFTDPGTLDTHTFGWTVLASNGHVVSAGNQQTFQFTPTDNGTYTVTFTVGDDDTGSSSDVVVVTVTNVAPTVAIAGAPATGSEGTPINLSGSVSDPGAADTLSYTWSVTKNGAAFAGGSAPTFGFTPDDNGMYVVTLTVTDDDGATGAPLAGFAITVANLAPTVTIYGAPAVSPEGTPVTLFSSVSDPGTADTLTYAWHVTKNGVGFASGSASTLSFTPNDDGTYVVTLTVTDDDGGAGSAGQTITVTNTALVLGGVTVGSPIFEGGSATLSGSFADPGSWDTFTLTIDWSDGSPFQSVSLAAGTTAFSVSHRYRNEGAYPVHLTLTDDDTGSATADRNVLVQNADIIVTGTDAGGGPHVRVFDANTGAEKFSFMAYDPAFTGGVRVATGDVNGDGQPDIITVAGPGGGPHVRVFDGTTGAPLAGLAGSFMAYDPAFTGGLYLAAGDVNSDGFTDVITGADAGGGPHVRAFSGRDGSVLHSFFVYSQDFTGGVRVAAGDVNGDGFADIITGAGAGGGPHVRVFSGADGEPLAGLAGSFFAYDPGFTNGIYVAVGDLNGDGRADIITGAGAGGGPHVKIFKGEPGALATGVPTEIASFFAYNPTFTGGVRVGATDVNGDGRDDLLTAAGPSGGPHVRAIDGLSLAELDSFFAYDPAFTGGTFLGGSRRR